MDCCTAHWRYPGTTNTGDVAASTDAGTEDIPGTVDTHSAGGEPLTNGTEAWIVEDEPWATGAMSYWSHATNHWT